MTDISGKKAIITGGAMGYGLATCKELLKAGCDVTIWDMAEKQMQDALEELKKMKLGKVYAYKCDVSDIKRVNELVEQAKKDMGSVDIMINNAAYLRVAYLVDMSISDIVKHTEVNVNAHYYTIKAVLPDMMARNSGWIVNISSAAAFVSMVRGVPYTCSKWAVHGMSDALRLEMKALGKNGVKVMSVHPGLAAGGSMFAGAKMSRITSLIFPKVEQAVLGQRIVNGIRKGRTMVCCPRSGYLFWMSRGWVPNSVYDSQQQLLGMSQFADTIVGRPGMAHTDVKDPGKKS